MPFLIRVLESREALDLAVYQRGLTNAAFRERSGRISRHVMEGVARLLLARRAEIGHPEPERAVAFAMAQLTSMLAHTFTAGFRDLTLVRLSDDGDRAGADRELSRVPEGARRAHALTHEEPHPMATQPVPPKLDWQTIDTYKTPMEVCLAVRLRDRHREAPQPLLEGEAEPVGRRAAARLVDRDRSVEADRRRGPLHLPPRAVLPAALEVAARDLHRARDRAAALAVPARRAGRADDRRGRSPTPCPTTRPSSTARRRPWTRRATSRCTSATSASSRSSTRSRRG